MDLTCEEAVLLPAPLVAVGQTVLFELAQGSPPDTHPQLAEGHACGSAHAEEVVRRRCGEPRFAMERVTEPE